MSKLPRLVGKEVLTTTKAGLTLVKKQTSQWGVFSSLAEPNSLFAMQKSIQADMSPVETRSAWGVGWA